MARNHRPRELAPCGTVAAYRRHRRRGEPACPACLQAERIRTGQRAGSPPTALVPDPRPIRNGLPVRPYVYRGLGYDQFEEATS